MRILIVEDEAAIRSELAEVLSVYGDCDEAQNGIEAVSAFEDAFRVNDTYDVICMDIVMPEKDGYQALREIREIEHMKGVPEENQAKIVMMSELNEGRNVKKAFDLGCDAYAGKPINRNKFTEAIEKLGIVG